MSLMRNGTASVLLAAAVVFTFSLSAMPASAAPAHMEGSGRDIRKTVIADGIYQFTIPRDSYVRQINSVVIVNQNDVLVFDTNTRPSSARLILGEIRKITDKPVRYLVNSHWHPDHWSGNEVYAQEFPGVEIIATEETRQFMQNVAPIWPRKFLDQAASSQAELDKEIKSGKGDDGAALTPEQLADDEADVRGYKSFAGEAASLHRTFPTLTYVDRLTLYHGGRELRFMSVTGDAEGTTVLYLPKEKVLITGDTVSYPIPFVRGARQEKSLRELARLDVDVIIPGHGPAFHDRSYLNLEISLLELVTRGVHEALQNGMQTLEEVQKAVTADELRVQFTHNDPDLDTRFRNRVKDLVKLVIREQKDGQDL